MKAFYSLSDIVPVFNPYIVFAKLPTKKINVYDNYFLVLFSDSIQVGLNDRRINLK